MTKISIPIRYAPTILTNRDRKSQIRAIQRSRKLYKKHMYYSRPRVPSFPHKTSKHIQNARRMYKLDRIVPNKALSIATGCSIPALKEIVRKGEGAYYSSGSRPNQSAQSWGYARLASSVTGGNASVVDFHILEDGCKCNSRVLQLAKERIKKGLRKTRKILINK